MPSEFATVATLVLKRAPQADMNTISEALCTRVAQPTETRTVVRRKGSDVIVIATPAADFALTRSSINTVTLASSAPQTSAKKARADLMPLITHLANTLDSKGVVWAGRKGALTFEFLDESIQDAQLLFTELASNAQPHLPLFARIGHTIVSAIENLIPSRV